MQLALYQMQNKGSLAPKELVSIRQKSKSQSSAQHEQPIELVGFLTLPLPLRQGSWFFKFK